MYLVRGEPPSLFGCFHDNEAVSRVTLEISSGPSGADGFSKRKLKHHNFEYSQTCL
jgi:hypothetical protein